MGESHFILAEFFTAETPAPIILDLLTLAFQQPIKEEDIRLTATHPHVVFAVDKLDSLFRIHPDHETRQLLNKDFLSTEGLKKPYILVKNKLTLSQWVLPQSDQHIQ